MNCHTVRALYELFGRDAQQFDADEQAALDRHLEACPACREWRRTDRQVDAELVAAMKNVATPAGLERRIRDRLSAARPRWPWGWISAGAGAAAAILIAVGIAMSLPQTVDLQSVLARFDEPIAQRREGAERHFAELGYRIQTPDELRYEEYLRSFDLTSFQNRRVPRLTLIGNGGGRLDVYVLSTSSFSLPSEWDGVELPSQSERHVLARRSGSFIYVYEWTGDALKEVSNLPH
jgi:hypothetical protein